MKRRARIAAAGALTALWVAALVALSTGDSFCRDDSTGRTGIDALDACASHHPLGLAITVLGDPVWWSFALVPAALAALLWPRRATRVVLAALATAAALDLAGGI